MNAREIGERLKPLAEKAADLPIIEGVGIHAETIEALDFVRAATDPFTILTLIEANRELAMALRDFCITPKIFPGRDGSGFIDGNLCNQCGSWWPADKPANHATTCVLAKTGWDKP
jgi:hypothetical protein